MDTIQKAILAVREQVQEEMLAQLEGRSTGRYDDDEEDDMATKLCEATEEIARLERRFLEETKAHDKTRHILECRERELERVRSNIYSERVEESMRTLLGEEKK